uniref:Cytochrome P450 n=1 Tax=Timema shepardi TaxID=629360 RepID=A0A7R9AXY7_TIMSH|nr:unnamed protein product [Timema shepardi]
MRRSTYFHSNGVLQWAHRNSRKFSHAGPKSFSEQETSFATKPQVAVKEFHEIPGPKALPFVGTLWRYLPLLGEYKMDRLHYNGFRKLRLFGPLVREELLPGINVVWVFTPEDIEQVFRSEGRYPERRSHLALAKCRRDRPHVYNTGGLLPTNGPEWLRLRSAFQRDLSRPNCVKTYLPAIDEVIQEFLNKITPGHNGNDFLPELSKLFLELICLVAFDVRLDSFNQNSELSSRLIDAALSINSSILRTDNGLQLWKWYGIRTLTILISPFMPYHPSMFGKGKRGLPSDLSSSCHLSGREVIARLLAFLPDIRSSSPSLPSEIYDVTNKNYTS